MVIVCMMRKEGQRDIVVIANVFDAYVTYLLIYLSYTLLVL